MSPVYRSPRSGSAAAATTPARLAQEFGEVLWRERPDGQIEVATMRDKQVERYVVHSDGSTTLVASSPPSAQARLIKPLMISGGVLCIAGFAGWAAVGSPNTLFLFFVGVALFMLAGWLSYKADTLSQRLEGEWHMPTNLRGWSPRSSEQLAAVEQIADDHDGVAYVRDLGARTADVVAMRRGRLEWYWVDDLGRAELADSTPAGPRYLADHIAERIAQVLWLLLIAAALLPVPHKVALLIAVGTALGGLTVAGILNERANSLERRAKRLRHAGEPWLEIRTQEPEDDGG
jgi:hypothetical protein